MVRFHLSRPVISDIFSSNKGEKEYYRRQRSLLVEAIAL